MAKNVVPATSPITVTKDANGYQVHITDAFKASALKAASDLQSMFIDVRPVAINLWKAYKKNCVDGPVSRLVFFNAFDSSIPTSYGKPGSQERKALDSHKVYNGLTYLTFKRGKIDAGDGPAKRDPKVAKAAAKKAEAAFGQWAKKYKLTAPAIKTLLVSILKFVDKSGDMTKKGTSYMKAAGINVSEE